MTKAQFNRKYMIQRHRELERVKISEQRADLAEKLNDQEEQDRVRMTTTSSKKRKQDSQRSLINVQSTESKQEVHTRLDNVSPVDRLDQAR